MGCPLTMMMLKAICKHTKPLKHTKHVNTIELHRIIVIFYNLLIAQHINIYLKSICFDHSALMFFMFSYYFGTNIAILLNVSLASGFGALSLTKTIAFWLFTICARHVR